MSAVPFAFGATFNWNEHRGQEDAKNYYRVQVVYVDIWKHKCFQPFQVRHCGDHLPSTNTSGSIEFISLTITFATLLLHIKTLGDYRRWATCTDDKDLQKHAAWKKMDGYTQLLMGKKQDFAENQWAPVPLWAAARRESPNQTQCSLCCPPTGRTSVMF